MRKLLTGILMIWLTSNCVYSQFDAQFSQYMHHTPGFNPAGVGESGMLDVTGQHRLHWVGMPNGGNTTLFSIHTPIKFAGINQGIGINFQNDRIGLFVNQAVHLQYALNFKVGNGNLRTGVQLGFLSIGFRGDSIRGPEVAIGDYHDISGDPAIPTTLSEGFGFDMGVGAMYTYKKMYAGISYSHLNQPVIEWSDEHFYRPAGTIYLTGGYAHSLKNKKYVVRPSFLLKSDMVLFQAELSVLMHVNNQYWGGLSYRYGDAVSIMAGMEITNGLSIGYSYDIPASAMITASWGSHEVFLSYEMKIGTGGDSRRNSYKSIRIL